MLINIHILNLRRCVFFNRRKIGQSAMRKYTISKGKNNEYFINKYSLGTQ